MNTFAPSIRNELEDRCRVFYVTAWGYAADHLFGWFPKALNCHHDLFALLAHEGSRPKYLRERTRGERPPLPAFTEFLDDMGMTYAAIGDCYSYRAGQMPELLAMPRYQSLPVVNLVRHPVAWLEFYVKWRSSNMRMREGASDPLAWEWKTSCHGYFQHLGLHAYGKDDIEIWASYQGMLQLNNVVSDIASVRRQQPIEAVAANPGVFSELVGYLSRGEVVFDQPSLDRAFSMRDVLFRGEAPVENDPAVLLGTWPGWKVDAFRSLVNSDALAAYKSLGYDLGGLARRPRILLKAPPRGLDRSLFVSSLPKSGTWLMREILTMMTGLEPHEPDIQDGLPKYDDEMLIEFPPGKFFSWHSVLTPKSMSLLRGAQTKNVFLIRNLFDLLQSMFNHLVHDVDASIDRSVGGAGFFEGMSEDQCMAMMIAGFTAPELTWNGVGPILRQLDSLLALAESGEALILDYTKLTEEKQSCIRQLAAHLGISLSSSRIRKIVAATARDAMRERLKQVGRESHVTANARRSGREAFLPYHMQMLDLQVLQHAPELPGRLARLGFREIL